MMEAAGSPTKNLDPIEAELTQTAHAFIKEWTLNLTAAWEKQVIYNLIQEQRTATEQLASNPLSYDQATALTSFLYKKIHEETTAAIAHTSKNLASDDPQINAPIVSAVPRRRIAAPIPPEASHRVLINLKEFKERLRLARQLKADEATGLISDRLGESLCRRCTLL